MELTTFELGITRDSVARNYNRIVRRARRGNDRPSTIAMELSTVKRILDKLDAELADREATS